MDLLISWYLVLFFFITQFLAFSPIVYYIYGMNMRETKYLVHRIQSLKMLLTGYEYQDRSDIYSTIYEMPYDLKDILAQFYDDLECGYLYSAQMHLKLTGDLIFDSGNNVLTSETIEDFSFNKEASLMIKSLVDPKKYWVNDLWLLYIYTHQMNVFFRRIIDGGTSNIEKMYDENKRMHDYVLSQIERRVYWCKSDNIFNMNYEKCEHFRIANYKIADKQEKKKNWFSTSSKSAQYSNRNTDADVIKAIWQNKYLVDKNFIHNCNENLLEFGTTQLFSFNFLVFQDTNILTHLLDEFLADDSDRFDLQLVEFDSGLMRIKSLGAYQNRVLGALEIIMLQITLSYTIKLAKSNNILADVITFDYAILFNFKNLMGLDNEHGMTLIETEIKKVYEDFKYCYKSWYSISESEHQDHFEKFKSSINGRIVRLIENITETHKLPKIKSIVTDSYQLSDIHTIGVKFVKKIKKDIGGESIGFVRSFLRMIVENNEISQLDD